MNEVVIDSNFLVTKLDEKDAWHSRAEEMDVEIPEGVQRVYFDTVVIESISVVARRFEEKKQQERFSVALALLKEKLPSSKVRWISSLVPLYYNDCLQMMLKSRGALNFNDCLIAIFMNRSGIKYIASFDADFDSVDGVVRISSVADVHKKLL